jgi:hypothetical protein
MACFALSALTLAAGEAPGIDLAWHVPFRGVVAVLNLLLYVTIIVVLTQERSNERA